MKLKKEEKPLKSLKSRDRALAAAHLALGKKAKDVLVLELKALTIIADYFVICSGESTTQVKAIADAIREGFSKNRIHALGIEGLSHGRWVLMDYGDVIVHIFDEETRAYYQLEKLWLDAPRIPVEEKGYRR
ncbi:MAG: ribosome silencing factor [Nitrospirae bacterium]|nr:MAG: ribosome silencing factor [Nitrospirota bacterium]